ncbi:lysosomal-trafficking regulator [Leptonychotes weddellii]|uniref:Lysosomal-trafficking regulator n=1 Tax=Leptonychotes weddellii TaxID=9713 RepID=A0A2U3YR59_LEPWE|nr:lysosomal-trafficking regulator [Leptonychotes weddellii]
MSIDSNSLAREFLTDVNRLCNAVVQRVEAREEEEEETHMATLGQYLVHGRGFLLLTKLNSVIDQALTCREELLTLLLSLLPLVWKIPVQEEKAAACQRVLVDLLVSLMSSRTCSEELTLLLRIFLEKSPCTEFLLLGILKIIESDIMMSPSQYLTFPLLHTPNLSNGVSSQKGPGILNSKALGLLRRARSSRSRKEAESGSCPQHLLSSWHVAPVHLALLGQNCWPHLSEGFSVSLWFNVECVHEAGRTTEKGKKTKKRNKSLILRDSSLDRTGNNRPEGAEYINPGERLIEEGCIHMISLGSKALMIQVWVDPHKGTFIFRMCMDSNDDTKAVLLAQAESQENIFIPSKWQHLVLTYLQQPQGKKNNHGKISIWISGQRKPDVTLDFVLPRKTSLSSDSNKTFCMIGHCLSSQEEFLQLAGKWDLGNLLLFNGAKIDSQEAFYLYACGPNHTSIMPCKYGKPVNDYSKYINKEILQCEQIRELFMTKKEVDIGLLIESLSVVYTTNCPAQYTIYEPVIRLKGQMKTQLSQRPFSSKEVQSILLESHHLKNLRPTECKTIQGILHEIGGTGIFVFLFARVVELSSCEETQALALRVILSLTKYNQQRIHELENCNGLSMIHQVLIKQKCIVGFHVLKTLLEGCCGEDIIHVNENGELKLDVESNAIIQDVKLLEELLLDWKIWNKAKQGAWEMLLAALEVLIRADHHQQVFNIKQLLKAQVVHHFLLTCQVLQEHKEGQLTSMPREVCRSFVKIIAEVLGSPPDLELLTVIFNFLLAVHPPTNTYVCHNPTNFYFSLHIDGKIFQEKVQSIIYLRHSSSGGKSVPSPGFMVISPSGFTASPPEGNNSCNIIPQRMTTNMLRSRSLPAFPTVSPQTQPQKLTGSLGYSIDKLQNIADNYVASQAEKLNSLVSSETLKKGKEDAFVSSFESAKAAYETEADLSARASVNGVPKGTLGFPAVKVDHKELAAEPRSDDDSPGDESCPRRPDYLKGLASFQHSHSTSASLGLAFPSQNGSAAVGRWPSLVDRNTTDEWENFAFSLGYEPDSSRTASTHSVTEDCLVPICCGLYELLSGVLLILPDVMLQDVMDKLIQADTLLVLVNHPSPAIQQGVIKLLDAYFNRASKEQKDKFLKNRGFSLLANQLYLHRGTQELLECFIEMFFGRRIGLDEEFDLEDVKNMGIFQKWSVIPILGLIETSLYDNMLLHSALLLLLQILNSCSKVADMLLDNGLLYVLCNTVAALNGLEKKYIRHGAKLVLYLSELIHNHQDELTEEELDTAELLMSALKLCGQKCVPPSATTKADLIKMIKEEQKKYETEEGTNKATWQKTVNNNQQSLFQRLDSKSKDISKIAADITQAVSLSQGIERKKVIQHIRGMYKVDLSASRHWQELIQQLTHDRAAWYDPLYYPTSWQLDPTEGPNRERRRLQRCYLTIPNKYLLWDRQKSEDVVKPPLSFLFEDKTHSSFSSTVKDKAASESIRVNRRCISVAPSRETAGELLLGKCGMYFVEDNASDTVESSSLQGELEPASFSWTYEEIKEVHKRWWQLRDNAVEIFLTNGRTLLLAFDNTKVRDDVYHSILTNNLPNLLEYGNINALTNLWYTGQITNFEYLTHLNKHAGRSFNDLMQYPVFPFILADYVSETLDLSDPSVYRNLSKPIAVQYKEKEDRYVDTYKYLEEEYRKGAREDDPMPPVQPYHYGSHYSNSGTVLHFLVRMPPFTKMFLAYQDQSFDIPDRTFHSTNTTWRLSSFESMTDVKELIPEFFYLPEFLVNREGFDFGVRQNGERVNHVNLPPWARNDPRLFILIHRQALESDYVSQNICQWIDLVFGYKQKGKASVQAINVFHPATYFGMDVSAVEDPVQRRALETMIKTYGQTPRQLFQSAHASRPGSKLNLEGELPAAVGLLVQFAFRENREQVKEITYPSPLSWIKGLKWGEYVGSPSAPVPVVCFSQPHGERFGSLQALPTRAICGLSQNFCLLMTYSKEQGVRSMNSTDIQWSAILSWGYADNILRLKSKQSEPPINFIQSSQQYQVTTCAWVPDSCHLFAGSKCGVITAYANRFTSSTPSEIEMESQIHLYGHTEEITSLFVCKPYSIMISVSRDGTCIIWDLNRLCYVQSLAGHKSPVTAVSASETTGDIATVCDSAGGGSDLRLWTVNGDLVGHVHCREIICSVAFSNQPEGVSINVIAGGLENGIVRLWSTWDLKPVREITFPKSNKPIVSLTFSCDGHHLYTANSDGTVIAWCRKDQQRLKQPMFYSFLSSYAAG